MSPTPQAVVPRLPTRRVSDTRLPPRFLMVVSARADPRLREEVRSGRRPRTEYLLLEETHGVELLDWSRLPGIADRRGVRLSLAHARAASRILAGYDAVLSDGEHVGVPLAILMRLLGISSAHVMIGHHLTTAAKRRVVRTLRPQAAIDRIVVHSGRQVDLVEQSLGIDARRLVLLPYCVDAAFWSPRPVSEERLIVAAGREHRDYVTLAEACRPLPARVRIAAGSLHSPSARQRMPAGWPSHVTTGYADPLALRDLYARASVVAIPLVETDFQAGVTTLLEAMAMGKAVVVSATSGQRDVVVDGVTAVTVPPGDVTAMRGALAGLLASPAERARLGAAARRAVENRFTLERYAGDLARQLRELAATAPAGRGRR